MDTEEESDVNYRLINLIDHEAEVLASGTFFIGSPRLVMSDGAFDRYIHNEYIAGVWSPKFKTINHTVGPGPYCDQFSNVYFARENMIGVSFVGHLDNWQLGRFMGKGKIVQIEKKFRIHFIKRNNINDLDKNTSSKHIFSLSVSIDCHSSYLIDLQHFAPVCECYKEMDWSEWDCGGNWRGNECRGYW